MTHTEIRQKFNEIMDFAEVERLLETPVGATFIAQGCPGSPPRHIGAGDPDRRRDAHGRATPSSRRNALGEMCKVAGNGRSLRPKDKSHMY